MKYMGSKARLAKHILPIILKNKKLDQWYVEPFVGGANLIDKVEGNRIGSDNNEYVISLFHGLQKGFIPPNRISEIEYEAAKNNRTVTPLTAFIGFCCSYSGKWFGGYARGWSEMNGPRNYCLEAKKNLLKQLPDIKEIHFKCESYEHLHIPPNSLIYCDPPYEGTTKYKDSIDYNIFWEWCRNKHKEGHDIFISSYIAPSDFICLWQKEIVSSLTRDTGGKTGIECLFTYEELI